ncbi:MAG: helix-turn-helix domain-containing protein [Fusobacterium sp.]
MSNLKNKYSCSMELTMDLIGGKWKLRILWYLNIGTKRFSEIKKLIPNITSKILTSQLREMERDNLLTRKIYPEVPPKVEYSITKYGRSLHSALEEMCKWGNNYANDHDIEL